MKIKLSLPALFASLCGTLFFACSPQASGDLIKFEFRGTITQLVDDPAGLVGRWGIIGDPMWGTLSYDPDSVRRVETGPGATTYTFSDNANPGSFELSVSTASLTRKAPESLVGWVRLSYSSTFDSFSAWGETGPPSSSVLNLVLEDSTGTALSNGSLPTDLELADWTRGYLEYTSSFQDALLIAEFSDLHRVPDTGGSLFLLSLAVVLMVARTTGNYVRYGRQ